MIILTSNILAVLVFLLTGILDLWLLVATLRLVLGQIPTARSSQLFPVLQGVADPPPHYVQQRLAAWRRRPVASWVPWTIVLIATLLTRQLLVSLLTAAR